MHLALSSATIATISGVMKSGNLKSKKKHYQFICIIKNYINNTNQFYLEKKITLAVIKTACNKIPKNIYLTIQFAMFFLIN